ncbi:hypothetical protein B1810_13815 [Panacagrimonas perspica]|nr:hypothetical protein B1810_13815 [Panacagrimonas perspica]
MCSWCWGFSPVIEQLARMLQGRATIRVLPGGLRPDVREPLSEHEVGYIMAEWRKIAQQTGQPFDFEQPLDTTYVYNTEPSCRALSVMIRERPACGLDYLKSLQQAFYVGRRDLKDPEVLADYAQSFGVPRAVFLDKLDQPAAVEAFNEDVGFARRCGIEGFPSVLLRSGLRIQRLTVGYQPIEVLQPHILRWLEAA